MINNLKQHACIVLPTDEPAFNIRSDCNNFTDLLCCKTVKL